jgi:predicted transcriptional regulator of viral defense system
MAEQSVLATIKQLRRHVFKTSEIAACCGKTLSNTIQTLNYLEKEGIIFKIARGIWGLDIGRDKLSPYSIIPFLFPGNRAYVSFISALHLYGIIEQIPQAITLASTVHTKTIKTKACTFFVHRIAPSFFKGFDWYKGRGDFLIAEPEKALIDCLYLSARKKKQFGYFPELHFPETFDFKKARHWADEIPDARIRLAVQKKLAVYLKQRK